MQKSPSDLKINIDYIVKVNALETFKELIDNIDKPIDENKIISKVFIRMKARV